MDIPEFTPDENGGFTVDDKVLQCFKEWGFVMVRGLLDREEVNILKSTVERDTGLQKTSYGKGDGKSRAPKLSIWDGPADDVTGMIARSEKVAGTFEKLLGGELYQYHAKVIMKDAKVGGAFVWHQDYGYWYKNGCLFPDMGTVHIPIDDADEENGCLKIIPKSHKVGRIEHAAAGDQAGADVERVNYIAKELGVIPMVMKAGDVLFFHCNVLHRSEQNDSERRRWAYLVCYNAKSNNPVFKHHHPFYTPLNKVPNSEIKKSRIPAEGEEIHRSREFFEGPQVDSSHIST